jgi:L-iditol 2-dehydrogenase
MRCAFLVEPGRVEVRETEAPRPGSGEVLVKIERALAGGTDRKAFARGHPLIPMPGPFGHRYAGRVAALGEGAPPFELDQPIMGVHSAPCLHCELCRKEHWNLCPDVMKEKVLGAFAQYLLVPAPVAKHNLFVRPASVSPEHAALLEPAACVVHGLLALDWRHVESVLVLGLGAVGLFFAQLLPHFTRAKRAGAGRRTKRLELARRFGLDPVWEVADPTRLPTEMNDERFDVVIECTGRLEGWQQAFAHANPGGQVLLFGGLPEETVFAVDSYRLHYEEIRLIGDFHFSPRDVVRARDFLLSGALELDPLIDGCFKLDELPEVMRRLQDSEGMQYAIDPW